MKTTALPPFLTSSCFSAKRFCHQWSGRSLYGTGVMETTGAAKSTPTRNVAHAATPNRICVSFMERVPFLFFL